MNYYSFHIGDFNNATRHLTRVERSLYRDLIDVYYDTEHALNGSDFDRLAKRILANSDEEKDALKCVLDEFFTLEDGEYRHERCDKEIAKYRANTESKRKAGKASGTARQQKLTHVEHVFNKCATNQEPITKNQELKTTPPLPPKGVDDRFEKFWKAYPRKQGKGAAEKAWKRIHVNGAFDSLLTALENQKQTEQWRKDNGQFVPNPATWLNQRRWEDEIPGGNHTDGTSSTNDIFRGAL